MARGATVAVDERPSWPLALVASVGGFEWASALALGAAAARWGRVEALPDKY